MFNAGKLLFIVLLLSFVACTKESDPPKKPDPIVPDLTGSYYGAAHDGDGSINTIKFNIEVNKVVSVYINEQLWNNTFTISPGSIEGVSYKFVDPNGGNFSVLVSPDKKYLGFVSYADVGVFTSGILEKDATQYATYNLQNYKGDWSGIGYALNADLDITGSGSTSTTTLSDGYFSGVDLYGPFQSNISSNVTLDATTYLARSQIALPNEDVVYITSILSPDGRATASYACTNNVRSLDNCDFSLMTRSRDNLINIELTGAVPVSERILQLSLGEVMANNSVSCTVTKPYNKGINCNTATYNGASLSIPVSGISGVSSLSLEYDPANTYANPTSEVVMPVSSNVAEINGNAEFAVTELTMRTQGHNTGYSYTVVVARNPDPWYQKAVLSGPDGDIVLWDRNFASVQNAYYQHDLNDGFPQKVVSYVSINSSADQNYYNSGDYVLLLSDHALHPDLKKAYSLYYSVPDQGLVNQYYMRADISVDNVSLSGHGYNSPLAIGSGAYSISWPDYSTISATHWQVRFRVVSGDGNTHLRNREFRSPRMQVGGPEGLTFDGNSGLFTWVAPPEFAIPLGASETLKINVLVSNSGNSLTEQSQGGFALTQ